MEIPGYKIEKEIGKGGMATVYLARHLGLDRLVAIKVMHRHLIDMDNSFSDRFLREARISASLTHPNIVTVYDVGVHDNNNYIAMEYLPGGITLESKLKEGLDLTSGLATIKQIAAALSFAHEEGIVHRDVKPDNIILRKDGSAVLADFGIARAVTSATKMTATGSMVGTPYYMSPEQAQGHEVGTYSDIYSLGVVLFEVLTGKVPYDAGSTVSTAIKHITDPIPVLEDELQSYQPIINRMMAKTSQERYETCDQVIADLNNIEISNDATVARRTVAMTVLSSDRHNDALKSVEGSPFRRKRPSGSKMILAVGIVLVGIILGVIFSPAGELIKGLIPVSEDVFQGQYSQSAKESYQEVTKSRQQWVDLVNQGYGKKINGADQEKAFDVLQEQLQSGDFKSVIDQAEILKAAYPNLPAFEQKRVAETKKLAARKAEKASAEKERIRKDVAAKKMSAEKERVRKLTAAKKAKFKGYASGLKMVNIPAGSFRMGSSETDYEKPTHTVKLKKYKLSQSKITFEQYDTYTNKAGKPLADDEGWGRGDRPVINVSWNDVKLYLNWLNKELKPNKKYRLPSEAEWEYAARAGSTTKYSWGDSIDCSKARYGQYGGTCGSEKNTTPVGSFDVNTFGLYGMHGNVWEWVEDCWNASYRGAPTDGSAWDSGDCRKRVLRGGSWYSVSSYLRSANRLNDTVGNRYYTIGFRIAQDH